MKEALTIDQDQIQNVKQVEIDKKLSKIGSFKPKKGQKVWEFNKVTGDICIATMEEQPLHFQKVQKSKLPPGKVYKIITKENCVYFPALNIENAVRKLGLNVQIVKGKK